MPDTPVTSNDLFIFAVIYLVMANKGGTGKSTFSRALIDLLKQAGFDVSIIEADNGIPDVGKTFGIQESFNLQNENGFLDVINKLAELGPGSPAVISTPAGLVERAMQDGPSFFSSLAQLEELIGHKVRIVWVIDNKRDSVETLSKFLKTLPYSIEIDVVENLFFASVEGYNFFETSKTKQALLARGGRVIRLPPLADRIAERLTNGRLSVEKAIPVLPLGERLELKRWVGECGKAFREAGYLP